MPKSSSYSKIMLLAILLTVAGMALQPLLPKKKLIISPSHYKNLDYFLAPVKDDPEGKKVYWVDPENPFHYQCNFEASKEEPPCNLMFRFAPDNEHGIDLTKYKSLRFDIRYTGSATGIRVAMRNFDPTFSTVTDTNSAKFHWMFLRNSEIGISNNNIPLADFIVADWWRSSYNLPRDKTRADLSNVTVLSFDFYDNITGHLQDVKITNIEFVGEWISKEQWYLCIILIWAFFGTVFALGHLIHLARKEKQQSEKIFELIVKNSELAGESDKYRKLSTVDALTNVFNRYGVEQIIENLVVSESTPISVMIFDIDNFKRVNDKRGHDCGDRVLQRISAIISSNTRTTDQFGRWGGEEFILICQNTSIGMAVALAEKLRIYICTAIFEPDNPLPVSASFGVAAVRPDEDFSMTFKRADQALYQAKYLGRNRVIVAEGDSPFDY